MTASDEMPDRVDVDEVAPRLAVVRARIAAAACAAGRNADDVRLVAVSKFHPLEKIAAAHAAGQLDIGESRAQELDAKLASDPPTGVRWHFVGRLQRNKVTMVAGRVVLIHSVDRGRLADAIAAHMQAIDGRQDVLIQVNVASEERKGGCAPADLPALAERIAGLDGIRAVGLMTIPPLDSDPRAVFDRLRALRTRLSSDHPAVRELSMGMSADLEDAVAAGATIVRVGTAIFGARPDSR
jgi:pyridoxal phosphate enzyme (YggS family)